MHHLSQLSGDAERPRLCVFRSNEHIYAQVRADWAAQGREPWCGGMGVPQR
jgi:ribosomal protein L18